MKISFDPGKEARTVADRGLSLMLGPEIIRNQVATRVDTRHDYGETRLIAIGYLGSRLHVCVYTVRGDTVHIISVRKASRKERRDHAAGL